MGLRGYGIIFNLNFIFGPLNSRNLNLTPSKFTLILHPAFFFPVRVSVQCSEGCTSESNKESESSAKARLDLSCNSFAKPLVPSQYFSKVHLLFYLSSFVLFISCSFCLVPVKFVVQSI